MEVSLLTGGEDRTLETVRILHETVLALRKALEGSNREIVQLKNHNHYPSRFKNDSVPPGGLFLNAMDSPDRTTNSPPNLQDENKPDSAADSDDIDDIELVFTMGETDPCSIHEDLVPILDDSVRKSLPDPLLETDISKCGVLDDCDHSFIPRRNTLPNPPPYQPILHRQILAASRMPPLSTPSKPLLPPTHEIAAQTDITALPPHWKSDTHLPHKISPNLTTLPSKFTLPVPQINRLPLADKTQEARRVLLSDINFTSMVPELSRSADHLHDEHAPPKPPLQPSLCPRHSHPHPHPHPHSHRPCPYPCPCPCPCHSPCLCFSPCSHTSSTSIPPRPLHPQLPFSLPSSPLKYPRPHRPRAKLRLRSLPNLRPEAESSESTDSLMDEAEEFLRRSMDRMVIGGAGPRRRETRASEATEASEASEAEGTSSVETPRRGRAFLPQSVKELQSGCVVKVITPGGRIAVGKVRFLGEVAGKAEAYVGVELGSCSGFSDGAFMGQRFFECERNRAVFVPFRKVVIGWEM